MKQTVNSKRFIYGVVWTDRDTRNLERWAACGGADRGVPRWLFREVSLETPSPTPKIGSIHLDSVTPRSDIISAKGSRKPNKTTPRWGDYQTRGELTTGLLVDDGWLLVGEYLSGKVFEKKDVLGRTWVACQNPDQYDQVEFARYTPEGRRTPVTVLTKLEYLGLFLGRAPVPEGL